MEVCKGRAHLPHHAQSARHRHAIRCFDYRKAVDLFHGHEARIYVLHGMKVVNFHKVSVVQGS
jgi:hypothetical protein